MTTPKAQTVVLCLCNIDRFLTSVGRYPALYHTGPLVGNWWKTERPTIERNDQTIYTYGNTVTVALQLEALTVLSGLRRQLLKLRQNVWVCPDLCYGYLWKDTGSYTD
jgi:hypothetical protein